MTKLDDTPAHKFEKDKEIEYEEAKLGRMNLGEEDHPKEILIRDD